MSDAVMEMDLDFSPAGMAMIGQHLEQAFVILLGGIKVSVDEWPPVRISPAVDDFWVFARPPFQATLLLWARGALLAVFGNDARLEMIGKGDDQMDGAARRRLQSAPSGRGEHLSCVIDLFLQAHFEILVFKS